MKLKLAVEISSSPMGLGLWHHATPALQLQGKIGREIQVNALSRFPEKPRGKRVHFHVDVEAQGDVGCVLPGFSQLCLGNVTRRTFLKKGVKSSGKFSPSGRNGGGIVASGARDSGESESSWGSEQGEKLLGCSVVAGSSLFWRPLWNHGGNVEGNTLELSGDGGDTGGGHGSGGKGGDGSSGNGGSDPSGHETHVSGVVEKKESGDEETIIEETPTMRSPDFRAPVLASLSSAAGDALDGEAPLGDLLLGRTKRPGAAEETAANVPSKTSEKGSQGGSSGPSSANESERSALGEEAAAHAAQLSQQKDGDEAFAKRSETAALKRLQREAFSDLMKVRERLDKLEFHTGLRKSKAQSSLGEGGAKTRLKGEVCAGGAFLLLDDQSSRYSRAALEQAGLHTGMDVRFTFETSYRERDVMITECSAGHSGSDGSILGGPISVTKLVYNAQVTDDLNVVVAPLGACASDVTETVNPLQGQALTQFARVGPAMYQHCVGSALGATLRGKTALVSLSQYLSGWGTRSSSSDGPLSSGPLCLSTLAHIMFQPCENSVFSLSAVNRFWPSPPLPSFRGLHWSEMGPLVLSKTRHSHKSGSSSPQMSSPQMSSPRDLRTSIDNTSLRDFRTSFDTPSGMSNNASWGTPCGEIERRVVPVSETHGNAMQSIALAGEIDVGANVSLAGWAQADRGYWLDESEMREIEWGVSLTKTVGKTVDWGLCVGSSKVDLWSAATNGENTFLGTGDGSGETCDMQLHMEAFMKLSMGRGFTLQPGLVYLLNRQSQTPALMLRSSWAL